MTLARPYLLGALLLTACGSSNAPRALGIAPANAAGRTEASAVAAAKKSAAHDLGCEGPFEVHEEDLANVRHWGGERPHDLTLVSGCGRRATYVVVERPPGYQMILVGIVPAE